LPSAAAHPKLAEAEGEQDGNDKSAAIYPLIYPTTTDKSLKQPFPQKLRAIQKKHGEMIMKGKVDLVMVCAGMQGPNDKSHVPLGLLYVGTQLKLAGYDVAIRHLLPEEFDAGISAIRAHNPLWVGLSVLSGMTTYYAAELSRRIKTEIPGTPVIWGGHHASAVPLQCLAADYIDYVIVGEGELTAVEFSDTLLQGGDMSKVQGLGWKSLDGQIHLNSARPLIEDLDSLELDWELLDMTQYNSGCSRGYRNVGFFSSRGCPYRCAFCTTPTYTGKSYRAHSVEFVLRHLSYLRERYGYNGVFFSDDNFIFNQERSLEIIRRLAARGIKVNTLDVRVNQLNEKVVKSFADFGVSGVFFGFESGSDRILKLVRKGITVEEIKVKARLLNKFGICAWASSIIGLPTETREEAYATIDLGMWLRDNLAENSVVCNYRYMPLPNTPLLDLAVKEGFPYPMTPEEWKVIDPIGPYYSSPWIKWMTPDDAKYFAWMQELGRARMFDFVRAAPLVPKIVHNFFARRFRVQALKRRSSMGLDMRAYCLMRDLYEIAVYGRRRRLISQAKLH